MTKIVQAFLSVFLFATMVAAQVSTSQLVGTVTDTSGAAVPGAKVIAVQVETGVSTQTISNSLGFYTFPQLQPGNYELRVRKEGFEVLIRPGITLIISQTSRV